MTLLDKIDSIEIQNKDSLYPWIEIMIKHTEPDCSGLDHSDSLKKRYQHRERELENFKQELLRLINQ